MSASDRLRAVVRALESAAQDYIDRGQPVPPRLIADLREGFDALKAWDAGRAGPALGLPGQTWDSFRNAVEPDAIRVAMPANLPAGRWGAGNTSIQIQTTANGTLVGGEAVTGGRRFRWQTSQSELARGEWPIPTVWALQGGIDCVGEGVENLEQGRIRVEGFPGGWSVRGYIEQTVESSSYRLPIFINQNGPFPLAQGIALQQFGVWTAQLVGQQIRVVVEEVFVETPPEPLLSFATYTIQVRALLGLFAASLPPQRTP